MGKDQKAEKSRTTTASSSFSTATNNGTTTATKERETNTQSFPVPHRIGSNTSLESHSFIYISEGDDDGSQAWCIVLCCFLTNVMVMGLLKALGTLIIEIKSSYHATPADVSILVSITTALNSIAGPLACYLVLIFTARSISFVGTILVSVGLMISWFAESIFYLHFSIGVLVGVGAGLTYSPGLILVGNYFQKNRGMANGIIMSGSPVGGMVMPYMINFLSEYLDCPGALLILGALMMHAVLCTLSYVPYKPPRGKRRRLGSSRSLIFTKQHGPHKMGDPTPISSVTTMSDVRKKEDDDNNSENYSSGPEFLMEEEETEDTSKSPRPSTGSVIIYKVNEHYGKSSKRRPHKPYRTMSKPPFWGEDPAKIRLSKFTSGTGQSIQSKASQTEIRKNVQKVVPHPFSNIHRKPIATTGSSGSSSLRTPTFGSSKPIHKDEEATAGSKGLKVPQSNTGSQTIESDLLLEGSSMLRHRRPQNNIYSKDQKLIPQSSPAPSSTKKLPPYILSLDHSCVIIWSTDNITKGHGLTNESSGPFNVSSIHSGSGDKGKEEPQQFQEEIIKPRQRKQKKCFPSSPKCCRKLWNWIRNSPLRYPTFLILLASNASTAIATTNILLLIPALAEHRGLTKAEASTVYMIISLCDLCFRLLGSFMFDRKLVKSKMLFAFGLSFAGFASCCIGLLADTFVKFCCFGAIFGLACGSHIGIFGALLAEVVGISWLPMGYAFCMTLNGILQFSFINISGWVLSHDKDAYTGLYSFYGLVLMGAGCLWLLPFFYLRCRKWRKGSSYAHEKHTNEGIPQDHQTASVLASGMSNSNISMF